MIVGNYAKDTRNFLSAYNKVESYVCKLIKNGSIDELVTGDDISWYDIFCKAVKSMNEDSSDVEIIPCSTDVIAKYFNGTNIAREVYTTKIRVNMDKMR